MKSKSVTLKERHSERGRLIMQSDRDSLALLVQQVEQRGGFLADEVDAGRVVHVVDHVPADALRAILLLTDQTHTPHTVTNLLCHCKHTLPSKLGTRKQYFK